ncbi:hypothetical protein TBLA_0E00940 [Henningerozyma blattae CBS 6284]|uniref:Protein HRI1 n=1 Tax=Henningerozyma blattae (strain ATCC 34711 / CBS 6284 / DSM 70876 / NBRC 10599 / NRRL Y-10934 / UCD 77-7) TaxID=1071380 RepID=I2H453_HENB6|nr:hypothetical protein TBLA_0E00940 [Tetrapisispora blattae CBS 6284]CCH61155.1 hypothetical protein TBLA_0E00940 [Tetrapisispora blattae CBS 6284]
MPSIAKRVAFQVGSDIFERTSTFSSASNNGYYISLRPLVKPSKTSEIEFPLEWAFCGTPDNIKITQKSENVTTQDFNFWLDTNTYLNVPNTHRGEVNTTWETWECGSLKESGSVFPNGKSSPGVNFIELWQPMRIDKSEEVVNITGVNNGRSIVFKVDDSNYQGLVVVVGKWVQGYLSKKNDGTIKGLNFIRSVQQADESYETTFKYGSDISKFPTNFTNLKVGEDVTVNGLAWTVVEYDA